MRVNKNNSLVGLTDFLIPFSILSKKAETYGKLLTITMTDSTKRMIFENNNTNNNLKIQVNVSIQYFDKAPSLKQSHSLPRSDMKTMALSPKVPSQNKPKETVLKHNKNNSSIQQTNKAHQKTPSMKKPMPSQGSFGSNTSGSGLINNKKKTHPQLSTTSNKNAFNSTSKKQQFKQKLNEDILQNENINNTNEMNDSSSLIDETIVNGVPPIKEAFTTYIENFIKANPLSSLNSYSSINELATRTKSIIDSFLQYQQDYYAYLTNAINTHNKIRNVYIRYNEKYRSALKKQNKLNEQLISTQMKYDYLMKITREQTNLIKEKILPVKENEIDSIKEAFNIDDKEIPVEPMQQHKSKQTKEENDLLHKTLVNIINNNKDFDMSALTKEEKDLLNEMIKERKGKETKKEETDVAMNNVIGKSLDENDIKLNNYLNQYYEKHKLPRIPFKKTSKNNYEYGTQKIMIKLEGETIRVRYIGGYILLDKFLEINAKAEDAKRNKRGKK